MAGGQMLSAPGLTLAVAAAIAAAPLFMAGCATSSPQVPTPATAMPSLPSTPAPATQAGHAVSYSSQVVLPFGDFINHMSGLAVDSASNAYARDYKYGQVWKQAAG